MVDVDLLAFQTRIDRSGWTQGLQEADKDLDEFTRRATAKLDALPAPSLKAPEMGPIGGSSAGPVEALGDGFAALSNQLDKIGVTMGGLGREIGGSLSGAIAPLGQFARRFEANFDEVGATVEQLAVRIDAAMRFPVFEQRINTFRDRIMRPFRRLPADVKAAVEPVEKVEPFAGIVDDSKAASAAVLDDWLKTGRKLGDYDLLGGVHVRPGGLKNFLLGLDTATGDALDRMRTKAQAVLSRPGNRGKGSRTAYNRRKANAAQVAAMQASRGDMDLVTPPTPRSRFRRVVEDPGWANLAAGAKAAAKGAALPFQFAGQTLKLFARDAAQSASAFAASWLGTAKVKGFFSSLGSVADATFEKLHKLRMPKIQVDPRQSTIVRGLGSAALTAAGHFTSLEKSVAGALGLFGMTYKVVDWFKGGIAGASGLTETVNKTDAVFGRISPKVKEFSQGLADGFGVDKKAALDLEAGFGGILKNLGGLSGDQLADTSNQLTQLAIDMESFANVDKAAAGTALRAMLVGNESDLLKQLGITYNEAALEAYAFAHGVNKSAEDMTEAEKVQIRLGIAMERSRDIQGDLAKTAGSTANMYRSLTGTLANFGTTVGEAVMPAIDQGLKLLRLGLDLVVAGFESSRELVGDWVDKCAAAFDLVAAAVAHPAAAFEVLKLYGKQSLANLLEYLGAFAENGIRLAGWIGDNWLLLIGDAFDATVVGLKNLWKNFLSIGDAIREFLRDPMKGVEVNWTPLLEGFRATASKLPDMVKPELTDLSKEIAEAGRPIMDDFARRRAEAAKAKEGFSEAKGDALAGANDNRPEKKKGHKKEDEFAGALQLGSKEAFSAFASAVYGTKAGRSEVDKNTAAMVEQQKAAVNQLVKIGGAVTAKGNIVHIPG